MDISIGSGLVFGLAFIGAAIIIIGTRDKINWINIIKKTFSRSLILLCFIGFASALVYFVIGVKNYYSKIQRSKSINYLSGICVTNTLEDVVFLKGYPDIIGSNKLGGIIFMYRSPDKTKADHLLICFSERQPKLNNLGTNRIAKILSKDENSIRNGDFGNISLGDGIDILKDQYNGDFQSEVQPNILERKYKIGNTQFFFRNNKLESVCIFNNDPDVIFSNTDIVWLKQ